MEELNIFFLSYKPPEPIQDFEDLMPTMVPGMPDNDFNVYVIAFQNNFGGLVTLEYYVLRLDVYFGQSRRSLKCAIKSCEGNVATLVYVKEEFMPLVDLHRSVSAGFTTADNQSSALVNMLVVDGSSFVFTNMQLKTSNLSKGINEIQRHLDVQLSNGDDYTATADAAFFLGTLPSFISTKTGKASTLAKKKKWEELALFDPLQKLLNDEHSFGGFKELPLTFQPTANYIQEGEHIFGFCDRILYRHNASCLVRPMTIKTNKGNLRYGTINDNRFARSKNKPVCMAMTVPILPIVELKRSLRNLAVDDSQLPQLYCRYIEIKLEDNSLALEGCVYLRFSGSWLNSQINNRAHFAPYGSKSITFHGEYIPKIMFKSEAIYAGVDASVLRHQYLVITLMHQNGLVDDIPVGTARVSLESAFKRSQDFHIEETIYLYGKRVGSVVGHVYVGYGNLDTPKQSITLKSLKEQSIKIREKQNGAKEKPEKKMPVYLTVSCSEEEHVNGHYYAFMKRLPHSRGAMEDTVDNCCVAYRNEAAVVLAHILNADGLEGWAFQQFNETIYFCADTHGDRHNGDFPSSGYVDTTFQGSKLKIQKNDACPKPSLDALMKDKRAAAVTIGVNTMKTKIQRKWAISAYRKKVSQGKGGGFAEVNSTDVEIDLLEHLQASKTDELVETFEKRKFGFLKSLLHNRYNDMEGNHINIPLFGNSWGQEERAKMSVTEDPTTRAIMLCKEDNIYPLLPKLLTCPLSIEVYGSLAVTQIPILVDMSMALEVEIDYHMYRLAEFYIDTSVDAAAVNEAFEFYPGGKYSGEIEEKYAAKLTLLERGQVT